MEFVLNTTRSTPESMGGGSGIMNFGDYKEGDDVSSETSTSVDKSDIKRITPDAEDDLLVDFDESRAREMLLAQHNIQIDLNREQRKDLCLEIGKHVSGGKPWKEVAKQKIQDNLTYVHRMEMPEIKTLYELLSELEDKERMLVGYTGATKLTIDDNEPFLFSTNAPATGQLVHKLEANDRRRLRHILFKHSRTWLDGVSEQEVNRLVDKTRSYTTEMEIQRLRPIGRHHKPFTFRMAEDVRDGYVELVSRRYGCDFDVLERRKIDVAVQAANRCVDREQQTDPTFPANSWTEYRYELYDELDAESGDDDDVNDNDDENALVKSASHCDTPKANESNVSETQIEPSKAVKDLLIALEFNSIDMYSN